MDRYEKEAWAKGFRLIAGTDEAGRGPLAGPVVAACVVWSPALYGLGVNDSKSLTPSCRERIFEEIRGRNVPYGLALVESGDIDRMNILKASLLAMAQAVTALAEEPDFLLIDGKFSVDLPVKQLPLIKGDKVSISVAAASIVAKVVRDRLMERYSQLFPWYNFCRNKGYPTPEHLRALAKHGPSPLHRLSFRGVEPPEHGHAQ